MRTSEVLRHLRKQQASPGARPRLLHRYGAFLPLTEATPPLSLGEGATPLGNHPQTPWGVPTIGYRTRKKGKQSDRYIVRGRRRGKKGGR